MCELPSDPVLQQQEGQPSARTSDAAVKDRKAASATVNATFPNTALMIAVLPSRPAYQTNESMITHFAGYVKYSMQLASRYYTRAVS